MNKKTLTKIAKGSLVIGALSVTAAADSEASELLRYQPLGSGAQVRSALVEQNSGFSNNIYGADANAGAKEGGEGKCGEGKCGEGKKEAPKKVEPKKDDKGGEGKCGEGKCGEGKK